MSEGISRTKPLSSMHLAAVALPMRPAPRRRRLHPWVQLLGALCPLLAASRAQATPELFVNLAYDVDATLQGCPSAADFRNIVGQQLGYNPYSGSATLRVEVRAHATERGIEGTIDWNDPTQKRVGERRFTSRNRDCHELMVAMGFVVAVQIQLLATERTASPASGPQAANAGSPEPVASRSETEPAAARPAPPAQPEPSLPVESPPSTPGHVPWSAIAGMGPAAAIGLGPNLAALGRIFFELQYAGASIELGAEASLPTETRQTDGIGFRQNLILGTIAACGYYRFASACALGKLGQIRVTGLGVDVSAAPTGFIAQAGPRLAATLGLGEQLLLRVHADALVLITPWNVELNHATFWTMPRFGAALGIDLAARFR